MAVDLEQEDEAERIAHAIRARRSGLLNRAYWGLLIVLAVYAAVRWVLGEAHERWPEWLVLVVAIGLPVLGLVNELGVFDHHAELRYRTKQINERLAEIEKTLSTRRNQE